MSWGLTAVLPPLQERLERLGTGWLACVFDWEGVLVDDCSAQHTEARRLAGRAFLVCANTA